MTFWLNAAYRESFWNFLRRLFVQMTMRSRLEN